MRNISNDILKDEMMLLDAMEAETGRCSRTSQSSGSVDTFENPCHPASVAYRITMSPHEWTWTQEEIEAMARWIVKNDNPQNMGIGGKLSTYDQ